MYTNVKDIDHLKTQDEIDFEAVDKERKLKADLSYQYELEGYMKRQPRLDLKKTVGNYNYEQFREYTELYEEAKKKDDEDLKQFYKMVKYTKLNADKGDKSAMSFAKKYRVDLIEVPAEFQDIAIDDIKIKKDKRSRRPIIKIRTSRDISKYDAWRNYDRTLIKGGGKQGCIRKINLIPAHLVKAFGLPEPTKIGFEGTGDYHFEDNNLDVFNIYDYKKTDFYWGLNRPEGEAYYNSPKNLSLPPHKRDRPWPTIAEFWASTEPHEFKLACQDQADWRKFRVWLKKVLREVAEQGESYKPFQEQAAEKFGSEVDICLGNNFAEVGKVNTDMAVYKYDYTYFMSADDLKKLKGDKAP